MRTSGGLGRMASPRTTTVRRALAEEQELLALGLW